MAKLHTLTSTITKKLVIIVCLTSKSRKLIFCKFEIHGFYRWKKEKHESKLSIYCVCLIHPSVWHCFLFYVRYVLNNKWKKHHYLFARSACLNIVFMQCKVTENSLSNLIAFAFIRILFHQKIEKPSFGIQPDEWRQPNIFISGQDLHLTLQKFFDLLKIVWLPYK